MTRIWIFGRACAALRLADDPAHRVAGGDGTRADELLAFLQTDVGDLAGGGIDLMERAGGKGIDLDGVDEAVAHRLHARRGVGLVDADRRIARLRRRFEARDRFELAGKRQGLWNLDDPDGLRRLACEDCRRRIVIGDVGRRKFCGAAGQRKTGQQENRPCGFAERWKSGFERSGQNGFTESRNDIFVRSRKVGF